MRVIAASFHDDAVARAAKARLQAELALDPHQVGVEPLADPSDATTTRAVLAGQFDDDLVAAARHVLEQLGGTIVVDTDATGTNA